MSNELYGEEIFSLERFNMNAKKLKESKLMEWFFENSLKIDFLVAKESPRSSFPPDQYFEPFLQTFQKCITDEQSSISAIANIYQKLDIQEDLVSRFEDFREGFNRCLDSKPFKDVVKASKEIQNLSLLNIMDVFMYGEFLFDHPKKAEMYEKITKDVHIREFYWFEFYMTVYKSTLVLFHIMMLNESLLKDLQAKS